MANTSDKTQKGELSKGKVERYQYDDKVGMYFDKELNLYLDSSSGISCCSSTILRTKIYHDTVNNCAYVWNALDQIYQMLELPSNYILKKQQEITGSIKPKKKKKRKAKGISFEAQASSSINEISLLTRETKEGRTTTRRTSKR